MRAAPAPVLQVTRSSRERIDMHVVVIGAGIIGVSTAYYLRLHGLDVTVLERNSGPAQETSFGNAGMIAPAYVAPWSQPGMPMKVLSYLFKTEAPVVFRPSFSPAQWRWVLRWLSACRLEPFRLNKQRMQRLAIHSRGLLHQLRAQHSIDYEQAQGILQLFRSDADLNRAKPSIQFLSENNISHRLLDAGQCRALEPALADGTPLAGGLHLPDDETGNCAYFARRLKDISEQMGVQYRFDTHVKRLHQLADRIARIELADGDLATDAVVVAAGVDSTKLLRPLGVRVPLYPVKGYSLTATITRHEFAPMMSVMDEAYKVAITRMGNRLRIAGTAEISDRRLTARDSALATLMKVARDWYPGAASYRQARPWVGARPMLPDGPPLLGKTPIGNLYLNLGHGSTGWAMACGSGQVVADIVANRPPEIDTEGLTLERYRHQ